MSYKLKDAVWSLL